MAQGSIRKGFFFYFGLLVLLFVTAFLICLVIMIFNPGKTVLGMKYFSGDKDIATTSTSGETTREIDFSRLTDININCNYAKVTVQRNQEYVDDCIVIRNHAKGFASSKKYNTFDYKIEVEGTTLNIDVTEPKGFLYFSKDIEIIIHDSNKQGALGNINLGAINLKVNATGKSTVYIGGTTNKSEQAFGLKSLDVSVNDGSISLGQMFNVSSIGGEIAAADGNDDLANVGLRLQNQKGQIKVISSANSITTGKAVVLGTNKGRINLDSVNTGSSKLTLECKRGTIAIKNVVAGNVVVKDCINGNYKFDTISCGISFRPSADSIISPMINIGEIKGDFALDTNGRTKDAPNITIKKAEGMVSVRSAKGTVKVENAKGAVSLQSDGSMTARVTVDRDNRNTVYITNEKGKVFLKYLGIVSTNAQITTNKAKVNIEFTKDANYTANCFKKDGTTPIDSRNVKVNIGSDEVGYDYDKEQGVLVFAGSTSKGQITINTNSSVNFNLVKVA